MHMHHVGVPRSEHRVLPRLPRDNASIMLGTGLGRVSNQAGSSLLERERELARIGVLLGAAADGIGGLLLIAGPAGIGKTALLARCGEDAAARGMLVLRAWGDQLGMDSSFAAVRELFWPEVERDSAGVLSGAARLAGPVFAAGRRGRDRRRADGQRASWAPLAGCEPGRPRSCCVAGRRCALARSGVGAFPCVSDRRIDSLPVLLAVAIRRGEGPGPVGVGAMLSEVAHEVLAPSALSEQAAAAIVRRELGARADEELCRSCHYSAAGNPFYLRTLLAALLAEGDAHR